MPIGEVEEVYLPAVAVAEPPRRGQPASCAASTETVLGHSMARGRAVRDRRRGERTQAGKSTIPRHAAGAARAGGRNHHRVDLVTTDGFLLPNAELEAAWADGPPRGSPRATTSAR